MAAKGSVEMLPVARPVARRWVAKVGVDKVDKVKLEKVAAAVATCPRHVSTG
jgi:hypothetical protein